MILLASVCCLCFARVSLDLNESWMAMGSVEVSPSWIGVVLAGGHGDKCILRGQRSLTNKRPKKNMRNVQYIVYIQKNSI